MHINLWTIEVDNEKRTSSGKILARPWLRDLDWEKAYIYTEAFGFSGFENDHEFTCNLIITTYELLCSEEYHAQCREFARRLLRATDLPDEAWEDTFNVMVHPLHRLCRALLPQMIDWDQVK